MPSNETLSRAAQVARNRLLAEPVQALTGDDREAARRLFSVLAHLENIAVLACARGGGVEYQLEDEEAHRETFEELARRLGGLEAAPASVQALTTFLAGLRGQASLACLNIVAEAWLGNTFRHVAPWGPWQPLLDAIEAEEARHSHEALELAKPHPADARPLVRRLERLLFDITADPEFMWPLAWFGGVAGAARMGQDALRAHERACAHLRITPSRWAKEIARCGRDAEEDETPTPLELSPWERSAFRVRLEPITCFVPVSMPFGVRRLSHIEAAVTRALGRVLEDVPFLNRSVHPVRHELWHPRSPVVAVRRLFDRLRLVTTVYVKNPQQHRRPAELAADIASKLRRIRSLRYRELPDVPESLQRLAPPSRVAATVTNCAGQFPPGTFGCTPLAPLEGATIAVTISPVTRRWWQLRRRVVLGISVDHRAHNGREQGILARELKRAIERG